MKYSTDVLNIRRRFVCCSHGNKEKNISIISKYISFTDFRDTHSFHMILNNGQMTRAHPFVLEKVFSAGEVVGEGMDEDVGVTQEQVTVGWVMMARRCNGHLGWPCVQGHGWHYQFSATF